MTVVAHAPGRVNLIGDHTDYTGGLVLPMAIDMGTTVRGTRVGDAVVLSSADEVEAARVALGVSGDDAARLSPAWARYVGGVVHEVRPAVGFDGVVTTTLPIGAGLSSSAALEVAVALALGFDGPALELALACQRAEQVASGVPCGVMDQLASAGGIDGHALLIDCTSLSIKPVALPDEVEVVVLHSGQERTLVGSAYAERRAACEAAAEIVGPLREVTVGGLVVIVDEVMRARARHVVTENARVMEFAAAMSAGDLARAGELMVASHASLRDDFEVSTPVLDALVDELFATPGVHGARLTGAGFGGCVVALTEPGTLPDRPLQWRVRPVGGASVEELDS